MCRIVSSLTAALAVSAVAYGVVPALDGGARATPAAAESAVGICCVSWL